MKTSYKRGFFGAILGFVFILGCIIGLYYFLFYKKTEYTAPPIREVEKATTTAQNLQTYTSTVEGTFEEKETISFEFSYPKNTFAVDASTDGKQVAISEITNVSAQIGSTTVATTTVLKHSLLVTYEGGRGFMPEDYWTEEGKKICSDCVKSVAPLQIPNAESSLTYENNKKIVYIVKSPKNTPFLFVFELQKPATNVVNVLRTFEFK